MTLGKRKYTEYFSDVLDDLKRPFPLGRIMQQRGFDFESKKCFISTHSKIRGVLPELFKMESFAVVINGF